MLYVMTTTRYNGKRMSKEMAQAVSAWMSYLGSKTSHKKAASSRRNGRLGGRPQLRYADGSDRSDSVKGPYLKS